MSKSRVAERSAAYALQTAVEPAFGTSFDLLATAPQGVAKLRELILQAFQEYEESAAVTS